MKSGVCMAGIMLMSLFFMTRSPLCPGKTGDLTADSAVFKTVALYMQNGLMPYRDIFDHKGPALYLINYCGNLISYYRGVWLIELLAISLTFLVIFFLARLSTGRINSLLLVITTSSILFAYFEMGNISEEYAMPLIALSTYIFVDYLKNNKINKLRLFICGAAFAVVLMLRVNMVGIWVIFSLAVLIVLCKERDYSSIIHYLIWFLFGALTILLPIILWLGINGALKYFWDDYIIFNCKYISDPYSGRGELALKVDSLICFASAPLVEISLLISAIAAVKKRNRVTISFFLAIIASILMVALSGQKYMHYGMILIPLLAFPIAELVGTAEAKGMNSYAGNIILALFTVYICGNCWSSHLAGLNESYHNQTSQIPTYSTSVVETINNSARDGDFLSVYGSWNVIYVKTKMLSPSRYTYQYPIGEVDPAILDTYFQELRNNPPRWLVVQQDYSDDRIQGFIREFNYQLVIDLDLSPVGRLYMKE